MPICPPRASVRAVFIPTEVPPRSSSLRHAIPRFASAITESGIVYMRSLFENTLISRDVKAAAASSTAVLVGRAPLESQSNEAIRGSLMSRAETMFIESSTTTPLSSKTKRALVPLRPMNSIMLFLTPRLRVRQLPMHRMYEMMHI